MGWINPKHGGHYITSNRFPATARLHRVVKLMFFPIASRLNQNYIITNKVNAFYISKLIISTHFIHSLLLKLHYRYNRAGAGVNLHKK